MAFKSLAELLEGRNFVKEIRAEQLAEKMKDAKRVPVKSLSTETLFTTKENV